jgi:hypothetical protein
MAETEMSFRSGREAFTLTILAASCILAFGAGPVLGSACTDPIERQIEFSRGSACWRYIGIGTSFIGNFRAGQKIKANAIGEYREMHRKFWASWELSIMGPDDAVLADTNFEHSEGKPLAVVIPQTGTYRFEIGPCAVWGYPGRVEICKSQ